MRYRALVLVAIAAISLTACKDTTAPGNPVTDEKSVALASAAVVDTAPYGEKLELYFGTNTSDTNSYSLGLQYFGWNKSNLSTSTVLNGTKKASLMAVMYGQYLALSETKASSIQVLSDWQAIDAENHRGVSYDGTTEFIFYVTRYKLNEGEKGQMYTPLWTKLYSQTKRAGKATARMDFPPEKTTDLIYVRVSQIHSFGCRGSDSLTFSSKNGFTLIRNDRYDTDWAAMSRRTKDATVTCDVYSSSAAANMALRARQGLSR